LDIGLQRRHSAGVLSLEGDHTLLSPAGLHHQSQPLDNLWSAVSHQLLIAAQQRVALRPVGDNRVYPGRYLDVGGKAGPARADYTRLFDFFNNLLSHSGVISFT
jgi:hypothetical protein